MHPLLGRRLNWGKAKKEQGQPVKVSRADILAISEILDKPLNRSIPGNAGIWIAEGIFRDSEGTLWFTDRYLFEQYRIQKSQLCWVRERGQLHHQNVVWPTRKMTRISGKMPGVVIVNHDSDVQKILRRRGVFFSGAKQPITEVWLTKYTIWRNANGTWFSSTWVAEQAGVSLTQVHNWQRDGRLPRTQLVQRDFVAKKGGAGAPVLVNHEDDVGRLLGWPAKPKTCQGDDAIHDAELGQPATNGNGQNEQATPKRKRIKARDQETLAVYRFCYIEYRLKGRTRPEVFAECFGKFGYPNDESNITNFANRYADYRGFPRKPSEAQAQSILAKLEAEGEKS